MRRFATLRGSRGAILAAGVVAILSAATTALPCAGAESAANSRETMRPVTPLDDCPRVEWAGHLSSASCCCDPASVLEPESSPLLDDVALPATVDSQISMDRLRITASATRLAAWKPPRALPVYLTTLRLRI